MRTPVIRGVCALAVFLAVSATPALAQSVLRGTVVDGQGKPVPDAQVVFEAEGVNRRANTKTDNKGEFLQVGLQSGAYKVTASKDGVGAQTLTATVRQGPNAPMKFALSAASGISAADKAAATAIQNLAVEAQKLMEAKQYDAAAAKLNEVLAKVPTCSDCYQNLGVIYKEQNKFAEAETAFKKVIEMKPDAGMAYSELTNIYNAQKKFDLAAEASANAAKYLSAGGGAASAEATFNQGVVAFNAGKFAEAKTAFEAATKADPTMAMAHYQLGMTSLNLGQFADAVAALEAYLKVDPNGPKAAEVKASLPALQGMVKK
jgi:protein O-GlcNAc transferase